MGRKSLAEKFYEETPEDENGAANTWLVIYDFRGIKPNPKFWKNLKRLIALLDNGSMIQYSVFKTRHKRGAHAAVKIAKHYGAEVRMFKGEEVELRKAIRA